MEDVVEASLDHVGGAGEGETEGASDPVCCLTAGGEEDLEVVHAGGVDALIVLADVEDAATAVSNEVGQLFLDMCPAC